MIERHVTINVLPGRQNDLASFVVQEYYPAMSRMAGFRGLSLLRDAESGASFTMVIEFESAELAAAWRASSEHKALSPRLKSMYSGSQLQTYDVIWRGSED